MGIYIMMVNPIYHIEVAVYTWFCWWFIHTD
jgi:hypothetical protein